MTAAEPFTVACQTLQAWADAARGQQPDAPPPLAESAWVIAGLPPQSTWPLLPDRLATIFSRLKQGSVALWQPPAELRCHEAALFPIDQPRAPDADLRQKLDKAVQAALGVTDLEQRVERLLAALQRYAWSWPSPLAAVSLYDLARLHAATQAAQIADPNGAICLIGGDLSGLQDFLYSVPAEGAARQLRGRSFYLQLLTDACARFVLRASGMPLCNLLYAGGGRFYVVAPGQMASKHQNPREGIASLSPSASGGRR